MIDVDYNEYKETIAQNMNLIIENHDLKEEVERLKEENYKLQKCLYEEELNVQDQNRELGIRIDKAIEFIENTRHTTSMTLEEMCDLEDILKGVDKNEKET